MMMGSSKQEQTDLERQTQSFSEEGVLRGGGAKGLASSHEQAPHPPRRASLEICLSTPENGIIPQRGNSEKPRNPFVMHLQMLLFFSLVSVFVLVGSLVCVFTHRSEHKLAVENYHALVAQTLEGATEEIMSLRRRAPQTMAHVAASAFPRVSAWPNVAIPAFETMAHNIMTQTPYVEELSFYPKVLPEALDERQQQGFENFAYDYFYNERNPPFPNGTAVQSFGRGIWKPEEPGSLKRIHDVDGATLWQSPNRVLFPMLQSSDDGTGGDLLMLYNLHSNDEIGRLIDDLIECSERRKAALVPEIECGVDEASVSFSRTSALIEPIYPVKDPFELTGIIMARVSWDGIMESMFRGTTVSGLTVVLQSRADPISYFVDKGKVMFSGEGDLHDESYSSFGHFATLDDDAGTAYSVAVYPTEQYFEAQETPNPIWAVLGVVAAVCISSLLFAAYDFAVRRKDRADQRVLQTTRKYMRFVSHEVRSPLNAVCMGITLLKDEIDRAIALSNNENNDVTACTLKEWQALLEDVSTSALSSVHVLDELLHYDRIESGTLALDLSVVSVWDVILSTSSEFELFAKSKKIHFELDKSDFVNALASCGDVDQHCIVGDAAKLTQILQSLVANAIKFTPEQGEVTVKMGWARCQHISRSKFDKHTLVSGEEITLERHGSVLLQVVDTGAGMSPERQQNLNRKGIQFNVSELQSEQGSGLGLYVTKAIIKKHGGYLNVSSDGLGHGTTFTCSLPLYHRCQSSTEEVTLMDQSPSTDSIVSSSRPTSPGRLMADENSIPLAPPLLIVPQEFKSIKKPNAPMNSSPLRVLVVDDVMSNRKLLKRLVMNHGHSAEEAIDGQDAVEKVADAMRSGCPFDTILMDYEMPRLCGPEAAKFIRKELHCDAFIVGVTGNVLAEDMEYFTLCGANAVLPKPIQMYRLEDLWMENCIWVRPTDAELKENA